MSQEVSKFLLVLGAVLTAVAEDPTTVAHAQTGPVGKLAVAAGAEYAHITEDEGFLGSGPGWMIGGEYKLTEATALGLELIFDRHVRDLNFFAVARDAQGRLQPLPYVERWEGEAIFVVGTVSHAFGVGRFVPIVFGGGGLMSHGGTLRGPRTAPEIPAGYVLEPGQVEPSRRGRSSRAVAIDGGGGVEWRVNERYALRPFGGIRLVNTGNAGPKYVIRGGVRAVVRW
jgi:hypothetical protein